MLATTCRMGAGVERQSRFIRIGFIPIATMCHSGILNVRVVDDPDVPLLTPVSFTDRFGMVLDNTTDTITWANLEGGPRTVMRIRVATHVEDKKRSLAKLV